MKIGQKFGLLTVSEKVQYGRVCVCDCGEPIVVSEKDLTDGVVSSCPNCKPQTNKAQKRNILYKLAISDNLEAYNKYAGVKLNFGKHKGQTLAHLLYHDTQYLSWLSGVVDPSKMKNQDVYAAFKIFGVFAIKLAKFESEAKNVS